MNPKDLGPLHALLVKGLPSWVDDNGVLRVYELASHLNISYQALYKIFSREKIAPKRVKALVLLSEGNLKFEDFLEFM
jgi:hypothetical protein